MATNQFLIQNNHRRAVRQKVSLIKAVIASKSNRRSKLASSRKFVNLKDYLLINEKTLF